MKRTEQSAPVAMVVTHEATVRLEWASVGAAHNAKPGPLYASSSPATEPDERSEREAFEAWANEDFYSGLADIGDTWDEGRETYTDFAHHMAFHAWQARALAAPTAPAPTEPVAWAIFTDAGNARMWTTFQPHVQKLADAEGLTVTPLYAAPQGQSKLNEIAKRRAEEVAAMEIADKDGRFLNAQGHQQAISAIDFCVAQFSQVTCVEPVPLTSRQRVLLAQAWTMLEDYAVMNRRVGNDSFADGAEASAHEIKLMLASAPTEPMSAPTAEPVAWARRHPDGTLTSEYLSDQSIEPVRKRSGGWVPLYATPPATAAGPSDAERVTAGGGFPGDHNGVKAAEKTAQLVYASPIFTTAINALNKVKAWRDCDGNDGFPHDVREQIDAVLMAYEIRATKGGKL